MGMKKEKIMKGLKDFKKKFLVVTLVTAVTFSGINLPVTTVNAATAVAPSVLSFVEQDDSTCTIKWSSVQGATYNVYKAKSRYATYNKVATVDTNSYTDTAYGGEYYKVTSVVNGTESSMSLATSYEIETFGYNTNIFEPTDNNSEIQSYINNVYKTTESGQFGSDRYAFLFAPGTYSDSLNVEIGFYTQVAGLGLTPTETTVGNIRSKAEWMKGKKYDRTRTQESI